MALPIKYKSLYARKSLDKKKLVWVNLSQGVQSMSIF